MNDEIVRQYMEYIERKKLIETELKSLPKGYISKKQIGNKEYQYLQCRDNDRIVSMYIKKANEKIMAEQLVLRKKYEKELPELKMHIQDLRNVAKEMDILLYRKLLMLELSYGMDDISLKQKEECLMFASAINEVEGVGVSEYTKRNLEAWKHGEMKFLDVFENVFRR